MSTHPIKPLAARDEALVLRLRKICMQYPAANERFSHGEPTWFAGKGKVFAMLDNHHHGSRHLAVWLPQPLGVQESLIEAQPSRFFRPPYVGPSGWVAVILDRDPDWALVEALVRDAYTFVAKKTLVARLLELEPNRAAEKPVAKKPAAKKPAAKKPAAKKPAAKKPAAKKHAAKKPAAKKPAAKKPAAKKPAAKKPAAKKPAAKKPAAKKPAAKKHAAKKPARRRTK